MLVSADLDKECPRHDLLKHGETKHIMGQAPKCIVGSHVSEHMQSAASNHELQRARARSVSVFLYDVVCIEQLNDRLSRIPLSPEKLNDIGQLI